MTAIDRTAYPCAGRRPDRAELRQHYDLCEAEHAFVRRHARGDTGRLLLALTLKTRTHLGYFPAPSEIARTVVDHLAAQFDTCAIAEGVANAIMLSNVVDMSAALTAMAEAGEPVTPEFVAALSPYLREHIRRFGQYVLDMDDLPGPLDPRSFRFAKALSDYARSSAAFTLVHIMNIGQLRVDLGDGAQQGSVPERARVSRNSSGSTAPRSNVGRRSWPRAGRMGSSVRCAAGRATAS